MPKVTKSIVARIKKFRTSWGEMAPDATFSGMTLAEFETATAPPLTKRDEITALKTQLDGKKTERSDADADANELLDLVVNSVKGTKGFGRDCALYRAFGYVRKSERKSGLTRKGSKSAAKPTGNANVA